MRVVVVGKGGREHALAQKIQSSRLLTQLWVCPGNPGMVAAGFQCVPSETAEQIEEFCVRNKISLVVVGPEAVILSDLKERLSRHGIPCFAPSPAAARLESSKIFCKEILQESGVKTAQGQVALNLSEAKSYLRRHDFHSPLVIKADGLAQGKGVWVCATLAQATEAVNTLVCQFGYPLLFEECLQGKELSAFALCDGEDFVVLGTACDYKRITPDPYSANTGGMGAYSPCDFITADEEKEICEVFRRTLRSLQEKNLSYQGFLFAGLMKTTKGLFVLEYNVRLGDPETQALLPRLKSDLLELIVAATSHELRNLRCDLSDEFAVHVVAVSEGYPQADMRLFQTIKVPKATELQGQLFYAGVGCQQGELVNTGGRVLGITALGMTKAEARTTAYADLDKISFAGMYRREDIAQ